MRTQEQTTSSVNVDHTGPGYHMSLREDGWYQALCVPEQNWAFDTVLF